MQKTLSIIDLSAIRANALRIRKLIGNRFFWAVVKADAYGHGAVEIAREIEDVADGFCVAIAEEGIALRLGGISKPVLVFAPPLDKDDADAISFYGLTPTVSDERSARLIGNNKCHIAVNTGMNRYGCFGEELKAVIGLIKRGNILGAYSHLYAAEDEARSEEQLARFKSECRVIRAHSTEAMLHISASGGMLRGGDFLMDGVRCGITLYGYAPKGFSRSGFAPALKVYARRAQSTAVTGGGVGYNVADERYSRLYTYRLGYADGFLRGVSLGEKTLCMDAFISKESAQFLPVFTDADDYAGRCGTISYEALCSVTRRSERIYERRTEI